MRRLSTWIDSTAWLARMTTSPHCEQPTDELQPVQTDQAKCWCLLPEIALLCGDCVGELAMQGMLVSG